MLGMRGAAWVMALACAAGLLLAPAWMAPTFAAGGLLLLGVALAAGWRGTVLWLAGTTLTVAGLAAPAPPAWTLPTLVLGLGLLLQSQAAPRPLPMLTGWGLLGLAAVLLALGRPTLDALLVAVPALGFLALQAFWTPRARERGWEAVALGSLLAASVAVSLAFAATRGWIGEVAPPGRLWAALLSLVLLAVACPAPAQRRLRLRGTVGTVFANGLVTLALLNVAFLTLTLVDRWSLKAILAVLLLWQGTMFTMEWRAVYHASRRLRAQRCAAPPPCPALTVVVPAFNDGACLAASLQHNLGIDGLRFVLVPAVASTDDTMEVAQRFGRSHPERIRIVQGDTGSKAGDLNKAWATLTEDTVLLLDSDETVDAGSLARGWQVMSSDPAIGLVQGRKVSRDPDDGPLARFVSAERRYSTWLDHVLHADHLGSAHFGGSAALVRRELPLALGGWTDRTLTEDIEFTLRTHLDGRWRIAYSDAFVVRESDPRTFADLLRQRTRWSRGWAQNADLFLGDVVRRRRRLGLRRAFGLSLLLLISISSLWTTFLPATLLMRLGGVSPLLPFVVAVPLSLVLLPSRFLSYSFAALRDPVIPLKRTPLRLAELALHAYLWIFLGWLVQLHALYLELSRSAREWHVTGKRAKPAPPVLVASPPPPVPVPAPE